MMIASRSYLCGGSRSSKAYTVCIHQGCTAVAYCCNGKECDCRQMHKGHAMQLCDYSDMVLPISFSSILRHKEVELTEENRRANGRHLALMEPSLPMNASSTISLRINKVGLNVLVGVCYRNRAQQLNYEPSEDSAQGTYLHNSSGTIYSDSILADNGQQLSEVRFTEGDIVIVSLQPITGRLTYTCNGKSFEQRTAIRSSTVEPVHFCVELWDSDVSILQ